MTPAKPASERFVAHARQLRWVPRERTRLLPIEGGRARRAWGWGDVDEAPVRPESVYGDRFRGLLACCDGGVETLVAKVSATPIQGKRDLVR
jgi:hypothetical protein